MKLHKRFISTSEYEEEYQLCDNLYLNRLNIYGFSKREFRVRSLDYSCRIAKRILNSIVPDLSISQLNEAIRIFNAYLSSFKYILKNEVKIEAVISASAYISIIRQGGYVSLLYISSKLRLKNYRSFASLVRRICMRLQIKRLPSPSIKDSLEHISSCVERYIREQCSRNRTTEEILLNIPTESENLYLNDINKDSLLESLIKGKNMDELVYNSTGARRQVKILSSRGKKDRFQFTTEALSNAKNFALYILRIVFEEEQVDRDNILSSIWFSKGVCSTPIVCAALFYSYRLYCKELLLKDIVKATGVSKSSVTNGRKIISNKLKVISENLFPGWLGPNCRKPEVEMPPSIMKSLVNLISCKINDSLDWS